MLGWQLRRSGESEEASSFEVLVEFAARFPVELEWSQLPVRDCRYMVYASVTCPASPPEDPQFNSLDEPGERLHFLTVYLSNAYQGAWELNACRRTSQYSGQTCSWTVCKLSRVNTEQACDRLSIVCGIEGS